MEEDVSRGITVSDYYEQRPPSDPTNETRHNPRINFRQERRRNGAVNLGQRSRRRGEVRQHSNRDEGQRLLLPPIAQRYEEVVTKASRALNFVKDLAIRIPRSIQNRDVRDPPYRQIQKVFVNCFDA